MKSIVYAKTTKSICFLVQMQIWIYELSKMKYYHLQNIFGLQIKSKRIHVPQLITPEGGQQDSKTMKSILGRQKQTVAH